MIGGNVCLWCDVTSFDPPVISSADINGANGTSDPNNIIEIYYNNIGCNHTVHTCSGETYIATVVADNAGNWTYTGAITGGSSITATRTDVDSSRTSALLTALSLPYTRWLV